MNSKIGKTANYLSALLLLAMGLMYLLKQSFMPYHSDAISLEWEQLNPTTQFLLLALMRAVSGGFIATAVVIVFLQNKFASNKSSWIPSLIIISGMIVSLTALYATLIVRLNSPGKPPTLLAIIGIILLLIGYLFNLKSIHK